MSKLPAPTFICPLCGAAKQHTSAEQQCVPILRARVAELEETIARQNNQLVDFYSLNAQNALLEGRLQVLLDAIRLAQHLIRCGTTDNAVLVLDDAFVATKENS